MSSTPDLQRVLATLASLSQPQQSVQPMESSLPPASHTIDRAQTPQNNAPQARTVIDPATITTWPEGLRCVTKIAAQNKEFETTIRRLMREQRAQEMRWYSERQQLMRTQAKRQQSSAQVTSILKSLTNSEADEGPGKQDQEAAAAAELAAFDMKIHRAQVELQNQVTLELKGIGVPFFGMDPSLVHIDSSTANAPSSATHITDVEMRQLQKRMILHLEDLYRD